MKLTYKNLARKHARAIIRLLPVQQALSATERHNQNVAVRQLSEAQAGVQTTETWRYR